VIDTTLILMLFLAQQGKPSVEAPQSKPGPAAAAPAQEVERPALSASEIKALRDTNLFAPRNAKRKTPSYTPSSRSSSRESSAPAKPKPPVITGIFFDGKAQAWLVVVEDRNESSLKQFKEPKFLKAGDEVSGLKVGAVTAEKASFLKGDTTKELKVGEALPVDEKHVSAAAPSPSSDDPESAEVEIKPVDSETNTKVLEELKKRRGKKERPSNDE
jgi:hypothetical protein